MIGARHDTIAEDECGRLDLVALEGRLAAGGVGTVVATAGTTSLGALDDVEAVADLCVAHGARLHIDAAYGGFFSLLADGGEPSVDPGPFRAIARADRSSSPPHKHGLQPYGCGSVLFADPGVARFYLHESPYTYFSTRDHDPGETTIECSRPGAAAAALWATLRALPLTREGLGSHLAGARAAGLALAGLLRVRGEVELVVEPGLDIVCVFARRPSAAAISEASERAFEALARAGWHVAKLRLEAEWLRRSHPWNRGRRTDGDRRPPLPDQARAPTGGRRAGRPACGRARRYQSAATPGLTLQSRRSGPWRPLTTRRLAAGPPAAGRWLPARSARGRPRRGRRRGSGRGQRRRERKVPTADEAERVSFPKRRGGPGDCLRDRRHAAWTVARIGSFGWSRKSWVSGGLPGWSSSTSNRRATAATANDASIVER